LHLLATRDLRRLILNYDTDRDPAETAAGAAAAQNRVDGFVREFGGARAGDQWTVEKTTVALACWQAQDSPLDGLPGLQTLERLICAAVVAAYPARGPSVQRWLDTRPDSAQTGPKHYVWSFYAGWYAHHGAESFYQHVWEDERVATELESRLAHVGIWPVVAEMAV